MSSDDETIGGEIAASDDDGMISEDEELEREMNAPDSADETQEIDDENEEIEQAEEVQQEEVSARIDSSMTRLPDVISKYQFVPLLTARIDQLNQGLRPFAKLSNGDKDPRKIAIAEIMNGTFPLAIVVGNVVCKMSHFTHFPTDFIEEMEQIRKTSSPA